VSSNCCFSDASISVRSARVSGIFFPQEGQEIDWSAMGASFAERIPCAILTQLYAEGVTGPVIRLFFAGELHAD
jgi:hypothetical protein